MMRNANAMEEPARWPEQVRETAEWYQQHGYPEQEGMFLFNHERSKAVEKSIKAFKKNCKTLKDTQGNIYYEDGQLDDWGEIRVGWINDVLMSDGDDRCYQVQTRLTSAVSAYVMVCLMGRYLTPQACALVIRDFKRAMQSGECDPPESRAILPELIKYIKGAFEAWNEGWGPWKEVIPDPDPELVPTK